MNYVTSVVLLLLLRSVVSSGQANRHDAPDTGATTGRAAIVRSVWRRIPSFEQFKEMFHKVYASPIEELTRRKLYNARMSQSFSAINKFQANQSSFYLSVNEMSDRTPQERRHLFMSPEVYAQEISKDASATEFYEKERMATLEASESSNDGTENKLGSLKSLGRLASLSWFLNPLNVFESLKRGLERLMPENGFDISDYVFAFMANFSRHDPSLPDEIFVDHRRLNCLNSARTQGECGNCYIFSAIALYEWAYCRFMGEKVKFSEQYPMDCGLSHLNPNPCDGGQVMQVADFIRESGFELLHMYKYNQSAGQCPYKTNESVPEMGAFVMDKPKLIQIPYRDAESQLRVSPILITIWTGDQFVSYGGGVHNGSDCRQPGAGLHAMLIVGSGRQDGHEYWILRNSHGIHWGEMGYYKLRKHNNCYYSFGEMRILEALDYRRVARALAENPTKPIKELGLDADGTKNLYSFKTNPKHDAKQLLARLKSLRSMKQSNETVE